MKHSLTNYCQTNESLLLLACSHCFFTKIVKKSSCETSPCRLPTPKFIHIPITEVKYLSIYLHTPLEDRLRFIKMTKKRSMQLYISRNLSYSNLSSGRGVFFMHSLICFHNVVDKCKLVKFKKFFESAVQLFQHCLVLFHYSLVIYLKTLFYCN